MGVCYAICIAQPLDTARIEANWDNILAYCCAQYEIDYLLRSTDTTANGDVIAKLKGVSLGNSGFNMTYVRNANQSIQNGSVIKGFEHYFDSLASVSQKIQSWDALFNVNQYSSKQKAEELRKILKSTYADRPAAKEKSYEMGLWDDISLVEIILIVLVVLLLVAVTVALAKISSDRTNLAHIKSRVHNLEENAYSSSNKASNKEYSRRSSSDASSMIQDLTLRVSRLESVVTSMKAKSVSEKSEVNNETVKEDYDSGTKEVKRNQETSKQSFFSVYLKNFNEGIMKECVVDEAQYELLLQDKQSSTGEFMFIGNIEAALATKDATFDYVCDLENWSMSSKSCETTENGKAEKMSDGKWRVVRKGKVKFS